MNESTRPCKSCGQPTQTTRHVYCAFCLKKRTDARRLVKYGISEEQYSALLYAQKGRCAICLRFPRSKRLAVDHNHKTGVVRGLLCSFCNHKLLGAGWDDPLRLRRAADYLDNPPFHHL